MIGKILTILYFTIVTIFGLEIELIEHETYLMAIFYFIALLEYLLVYLFLKSYGLI